VRDLEEAFRAYSWVVGEHERPTEALHREPQSIVVDDAVAEQAVNRLLPAPAWVNDE